MTKRLSIAVLAAGALLLSACGNETTTASGSGTSTSDTTTTTTSAAAEELEPVDCGEVTLSSGVHQLFADPAANGVVGCTEAFNVIDEFTKLPAEQRSQASLGNVELPSGWSCTVDDGETANMGCVKDKTGDRYGLALHTEQRS